MSESIDFIKDRATKTISAAKQVASQWVWEEMTIVQMQAALDAITGNKAISPPVIGQEEIASQAEQEMLSARGQWDAQLDILHRRTVQASAMAKAKFRNDPATLAVLAPLTASSNSRSETLAEALALESAWSKVAPTWNPMPANTLAAFKTLRKTCAEDLQGAYSDAKSAWRKEVEKLGNAGRQLEDANEAWYAAATAVFASDTSEGAMIRSTVPTTYTPPAEKPPTPAPTPPPT